MINSVQILHNNSILLQPFENYCFCSSDQLYTKLYRWRVSVSNENKHYPRVVAPHIFCVFFTPTRTFGNKIQFDLIISEIYENLLFFCKFPGGRCSGCTFHALNMKLWIIMNIRNWISCVTTLFCVNYRTRCFKN